MKSRITTGQGDEGSTRTLEGCVVDKSHPAMEALGALDALRAQTALLRLQLLDVSPGSRPEINVLLFLLHSYFLIGTAISDPRSHRAEQRRVTLAKKHLDRIEGEQQRMESKLLLPSAFIVSATNIVAAQADIVAASARTFERSLVAFCRMAPDFEQPTCLAFANRLGDYFFVLARHLEKGHHQSVNYTCLDEL